MMLKTMLGNRMRLLAGLVASMMFSLPAAAHDPVAFENWFAVCDHDGYCSAWTKGASGTPGANGIEDVVSIGRHAQGTYWEVSFVLGAQIARPEILTVDVDGAEENFSSPDDLGAFGSPFTYFLLGPKAQAVMDRLAPGTTMGISFATLAGAPGGTEFPLAGLNAALIWIDEQQRRLGSERVAETAPLGLDRIVVGQKLGEIAVGDLPADLVAMHEARPDACDPLDMLNSDPAAYDLGEDGTLFFVPCTEGAYNHWFAAYLGTKWGYELQHFASVRYDGGIAADDGVWQPSFDSATRTLETYNLGNSMGACGTRATHVWEGREFVLIRASAKPECDETGEPGEFPIIYERAASPD
jgi:hypothetical protein